MGKGMNNLIKKGVVVAVILLFIIVSVVPSTGTRVSFDDITPPVTTCTLNPPEPNGDNSWYVSDVEVTLNATDDMSGVNVTQFRFNAGGTHTYTEPLNITTDGEHIVEYRSIDYAGNVEDWKSVEFKIDQTKPHIDIGSEIVEGEIFITATAEDASSGMNRVEFYYCDDLQETVYGPGPDYQWNFNETNKSKYKRYKTFGIILNPKTYDQNITFFAIIVSIAEYSYDPMTSYVIGYDNAGNWDDAHFTPPPCVIFPKIYLFQQVTVPRYYRGYLGTFLVNAWFRNWD